MHALVADFRIRGKSGCHSDLKRHAFHARLLCMHNCAFLPAAHACRTSDKKLLSAADKKLPSGGSRLRQKITIGRVSRAGGGVPRALVRVCFWGLVVRLPLRRSSLGLCRSDSISDRTNPTTNPPCSIAHRSALSIPKERSHHAGSLTTAPPKNKPFAPATWRQRHLNGGR